MYHIKNVLYHRIKQLVKKHEKTADKLCNIHIENRLTNRKTYNIIKTQMYTSTKIEFKMKHKITSRNLNE